MPLKYKYKTKAEVPTEHAALYVEKDGVWILDAEGATDVEKLNEFRTTNTDFLKLLGAASIKEAKEKLEKLKDVNPDLYAKLKQDAEDLETAKLTNKGQYDIALAAQKTTMQRDFDAKLSDLQKKYDAATARLQVELIDNAVATAAAKKGVRATALLDVKTRARNVFRLVDEEIRAFETADKPKFNAAGDPLKIEEWVETLATDAPHLFEANAGSGGQGGGGAGGYAGPNPYDKKTQNLSAQAKLERENPKLAGQLKQAAAGNAPGTR